MQTFLPYPDFRRSAEVLDYRRLGKQRVEARQIYNTVIGVSEGWKSHPATKMWMGYPEALAGYHDTMILEWIARGYRNTMKVLLPEQDHYPLLVAPMPHWFGRDDVHSSHRANLLRKDPVWYGQFGWTEEPAEGYVWPI